MNKTVIILIQLIVILVLIYLLTVKEKPEVITISTPYFIEVPVDSLIPVEVIVPRYLPAVIDTAAVIQDYFSKRNYEQRLKVEKIGYVDVKFSVGENRLQGLEYKYNLSIPQQKQYRHEIGAMVGYEMYVLQYDYNLNKRWTVKTGYEFKHNTPLIGIGFKF